MTALQRSKGTLPRVLVVVGILGFLLQWANLVYVARSFGCDSPFLICPVEKLPWEGGDTPVFLRIATKIREQGFLGVPFHTKTPGA